MEYKIIDSKEEFLEFKDIWNNFYLKNSFNVFASFDWNYHWYTTDYYNNRPFIIVFYQSSFKDIKGVFPLMIDKKGVLRFIADTHSDFSNFLLKINTNIELKDIFKIFSNIIESDNEIKAIEFSNLNQDLIWIAELLNTQDYKKLIYQKNAYSYIKIDYEKKLFDSFAKLNSKQRNKLKKDYLINSKYNSKFYDNNENFPTDKVLLIVQDMIERGDRDKNYLNSNLLHLIEQMFNVGLLKVHEIYDDSETVAIQFILIQDNEYIFWIDLYKDIHLINIYAYIKFIDMLIENSDLRKDYINFGRGLYDYKTVKFQPIKKIQLTYYYAKSNFTFVKKLFSMFLKLSILNFYKRHSKTINKILGR